jgi:hypothetical protein
MRTLFASILLIAMTACGGKSASKTDAPNGNDGSAGSDGPGGATTVTVTLTNAPSSGSAYSFIAAYADGSGAWQLAPAPTSNAYSLSISSTSWSFAWTCVEPAAPKDSFVELAYFDISEKTSLTETVPDGCTDATPPATATLMGTVTGALATGNTVVYFGDSKGVLKADGSYTITTPTGTHDIVVVHYPAATAGADEIADGAVVVRSVAVNADTTQGAIAYTGATVASDAVTAATGSTIATVGTVLYSANGTTDVPFVVQAAVGTGYTTEGLAAADGVAADLYLQDVTGKAAGGEVQNWIGSAVAAQTFTEPAAFGGATVGTVTATPYPLWATTWPVYTNAVGYTWDATQGVAGAVEWEAVIGAMYAGSGSTATFTMPNLSTLTGWSTALQFATTGNGTGMVRAVTSTAGAKDYPPNAVPAPGTVRTFATGKFTFTP